MFIPFNTFFLSALSCSNISYNLTFFKTSSISESEYKLSGSKLVFKVPSNKNGSCGTMDKLLLNFFNGISWIFSPSISIFPSKASIILNNDKVRLDFPLPVLPIIPIFSPGFISKLILLSAKSQSFLYFIEKFSNNTLPWSGHDLFDKSYFVSFNFSSS